MEESPPNLELREPASPDALLPDALISPLWYVALGLLLLALIVWVVVTRKRRAVAEDPLAKRQAAYREALEGLQEIEANSPRQTAVLVSLILRKYLSIAAKDPALFETHEEFISRSDALKALSPPARDACAAGFTRLAALKYAPEPPAADPQTIVSDNRNLLETLHAGFQG